MALNLLLVPFYGSLGAALATLVATLVFNVLLWMYARQLAGINTLGWLLPSRKRA
ncbi:MAG: polysaccharide biosynthesis C-terminal domain-containing protein [Halioglobus sp.]